jgi:hypothetical protein
MNPYYLSKAYITNNVFNKYMINVSTTAINTCKKYLNLIKEEINSSTYLINNLAILTEK